MSKIFECVPDYSEGQDKAKVDAIVAEITKVPGINLLDVQMDADHNRSVVTYVGGADAVAEAAFQAARKAAELIDLTVHKGEHPRMGAADVIPFIPLNDATMEDAVAVAKKVGERIGNELDIPVFFYEDAATRPERKNLAKVRKGQFEGLRDEIGVNPEREPDCGPNRIHPTAGATAVGAREFLIAFNVNLDTDDLELAKTIATTVREASGGFPCVKGMGFEIAERGIVQVSMNMTNFHITSLNTVYDKIAAMAADAGVAVIESEVVGLVPAKSLTDSAIEHLGVADFTDDQVLDNRLAEAKGDPLQAATPFVEALASNAPAPGGGSASALAASMGAALAAMVCNLTVGRKKFAEVEDEARGYLGEAEALAVELDGLIKTDAQAFDAVGDAFAMPKETDGENAARSGAIQAGMKGAAEVPLTVMQKGAAALALAEKIVKIGNPNALSDIGVAALMAAAGVRGAQLNVEINLGSIKDEAFNGKMRSQCASVMAAVDAAEKRVLDEVRERIVG